MTYTGTPGADYRRPERGQRLEESTDVLVDGPFIREQRLSSHGAPGTSNSTCPGR